MRTISQAIKDKRAAVASDAPRWTVRINGTDVTAKLLRDGIRGIDLSVEKEIGDVKPGDVHILFDDPAYIKTIALLNWTDTIEIDLGFGADKVTNYFQGYIDPDNTEEDDLGIELVAVTEAKKLDRIAISAHLGIEQCKTVRKLLTDLNTSLGYTLSVPADMTYPIDVPSDKNASWVEFARQALSLGTLEASYGPGTVQTGISHRRGQKTSVAIVDAQPGAYNWYYVIPIREKVFAYGVNYNEGNEPVFTKLWEKVAANNVWRMRIFYATGSGATAKVVFGSGEYPYPAGGNNPNDVSKPQEFWVVTISSGANVHFGTFPAFSGVTHGFVTLESCGYFPDINRIVCAGHVNALSGQEIMKFNYVDPSTSPGTITFTSASQTQTISTTKNTNFGIRAGATNRLSSIYHHFVHGWSVAKIQSSDNAIVLGGELPGDPLENGATFVGDAAGANRVYYIASSTKIYDSAMNSWIHGMSSATWNDVMHGAEDSGDAYVQVLDDDYLRWYKISKGTLADPTPITSFWNSQIKLPTIFENNDVKEYSAHRFGAPAYISDKLALIVEHSYDMRAQDGEFEGTGIIYIGERVVPSLVFHNFDLDTQDSIRKFLEDASLASGRYWNPIPYRTIHILSRKITGVAVATFQKSDYIMDSFKIRRIRIADFIEVNGTIYGPTQFGGAPLSIAVEWLPSNHARDLAKFYDSIYANARKFYELDGNFLIEVEPFDNISVVGPDGVTYTGFVTKIIQSDIGTRLELMEVFV